MLKQIELNSFEIMKEVASYIFRNRENCKAEMHNPDLTIHIEIREDGIVTMTEKGIEAYDCQLFHSIAANLYAADRSDHLAKVAIIAASILSFVSIVCSIVVAIIS